MAFRLANDRNGTVVGVVSDLHAPFIHPNYLPFLLDTFNENKVTDIVFIGDIVDNHAISRHMTEPSATGAYYEYQNALESLMPYLNAFPKARLCLGNHDAIPERQIATLGMPEIFLKSFRDLWGLPSKWEIDISFIIDDVLYHHGLGASGVNGAINMALTQRMSTVQGHEHSSLKVDYKANQRDMIFGMSVGCGVDNKAYAFEYGKFSKNKPILGTGIVKNSSHAFVVPMGTEYFRTIGE
jgi:hypothetical protein